jgi:hypothetical protein
MKLKAFTNLSYSPSGGGDVKPQMQLLITHRSSGLVSVIEIVGSLMMSS